MKIRNQEFSNYTYVMAILNLTPDSFFEQSRVKSSDDLLKRAEKAINDGAAILDLGAQSTRPGHTKISPEEEIKRLIEPLKALRREFKDIPISIDTYYKDVAKIALDNGADLINDIWGLQYDDQMAKVIGEYDASTCIMFNKDGNDYVDMWQEMYAFFDKSLALAKKYNISDDKICLDGGIGFGKDAEQNIEVLKNYTNLNRFGYPLLLGTSRKRFLGGNVEDRLEGTLKTTEFAAKKKILFVRVHDVKENYEVIKRVYENNN